MSVQTETGQIIKKLDELIDLVKKNMGNVENHTHHHYPPYPNHYPSYPYWTTSGGTTGPNLTGVTYTNRTENGPTT